MIPFTHLNRIQDTHYIHFGGLLEVEKWPDVSVLGGPALTSENL